MTSYKVVATNMAGRVSWVVVPSLQTALGIISSFLQRKQNVSCYPTDEPVTHKNSYAADSYLQVAQLLPLRAAAPLSTDAFN